MTSAIGSGLEAIPFQSAVLDRAGVIVAVNRAWRTFAEQNGGSAAVRAGVGLNYLEICRRACGSDDHDAYLAVQSFERVLAGAKSTASFQYRCHTASETSWFVCNTSLAADGVLVAHIPLDEQRAVRGSLGDAPEHRTDGDTDEGWPSAATGDRDVPFDRHMQALSGTGGWELRLPRGELRWTPETFCIHGVQPGEFKPSLASMLQCYSARGQDRLNLALVKAERFGVPFDLELTLRRDPQVHVRVAGRAELSTFRPRRLYGIVQGVTGTRTPARRQAD